MEMKIDDFDNTLVCDQEDMQTVLSFFKEYRVLPEYIEKAILKVIIEELYNKNISFISIEDYLNSMPCGFIKNAIADINTMFSAKYKANYDQSYYSYLLYYLPVNIFKIWKPLLDLQVKNILKPDIYVLDIGTGPGSIPIGIIEYYKSLAESFPYIHFSISFVLVDKEQEFLDIAEKMINLIKEETPPNLNINIEEMICQKIDDCSKLHSLNKFDLITMSNFISANEGENNKNALRIITKARDHLENNGSIIIVETGEEINCRYLKMIRNEIVNNDILNVFSPCIGIWEDKTTYNCNCYSTVRCFWKPPSIYKYLEDRGLNKGKRDGIPFSYVVLRKDGLKKYEVEKNHQHFVELKYLEKYIGQIVNVKAIIRTVVEKGDKINISICDGSHCCNEDKNAIWINNIYIKDLYRQGIDIPIIAAEKITLRKVLVKSRDGKINIEIGENTRIAIDY